MLTPAVSALIFCCFGAWVLSKASGAPPKLRQELNLIFISIALFLAVTLAPSMGGINRAITSVTLRIVLCAFGLAFSMARCREKETIISGIVFTSISVWLVFVFLRELYRLGV